MRLFKEHYRDLFNNGNGNNYHYSSYDGTGYGDGSYYGNGHGDGQGCGHSENYHKGGTNLYARENLNFPTALVQYWR